MTGQSRLMDALMGYARQGVNDFRGVDPATGEADYWKRGGLAGLLGMSSALEQSPQDIAMGFAGSVTPKVGGLLSAGTKPIRAYHGSPHDFDKFDLSKIGTGEGAQAYGHGLYFAEREGVARSYRDNLTSGADPRAFTSEIINSLRGKIPGEISRDTLKLELRKYPETSQLAADDAAMGHLHTAANGYDLKTDTYSPAGLRALQNLDTLLPQPNKGRMYEVDIHADPSRFLDWDKPLSGQPETVKKVMGFDPRASQEAEQAVFELARQRGVPPTSLPEYRALEAQMDAARAMDQRYPTGGNIYESQKLVPGEYTDKSAASKALRDAGIPGIKYLDQGSRGSGTGTSNYVVFDDKLIEILKKYGIAGLTGGGAMGFGSMGGAADY